MTCTSTSRRYDWRRNPTGRSRKKREKRYDCVGPLLCANAERAYREYRDELPDPPWDMAKTIDAVCRVAQARAMKIEF